MNHRTTEPAAAPIGQAAAEGTFARAIRHLIKTAENREADAIEYEAAAASDEKSAATARDMARDIRTVASELRTAADKLSRAKTEQ